MTLQDIALRRLVNQQLRGSGISEPAELVKWMGCIRAEDIAAAGWAIGSRVRESTEESIAAAFRAGEIVHTHVLQPAGHFIAPQDIRWMLALTAPRLKAFHRDLYSMLGIDAVLRRKTRQVMARALRDAPLTAPQVGERLKRENISADKLRLKLLLMDAELDGLLCGAGMDGQQLRYALLDQHAPPTSRPLSKEESLVELTKRYFHSRGPATVDDFAGWSGLRPPEIKIGMEMNRKGLRSDVVNGQQYWSAPASWEYTGSRPPPLHPSPSLHSSPSLPLSVSLLPPLDELAIAYAGAPVFKPILFIDGHPAGSWNNLRSKDTITINVHTPVKMNAALRAAIRQEAERYSLFLGRRLSFNN